MPGRGLIFGSAARKSPPAAPKAEDDSLPLAQGDQAVVRVNGVEIGQSDIAFADEEVGGTMPAMAPEQKREYLVTYLTDVVILAQAAKKQKLDDSPEVKRQIEFARPFRDLELLGVTALEAANAVGHHGFVALKTDLYMAQPSVGEGSEFLEGHFLV